MIGAETPPGFLDVRGNQEVRLGSPSVSRGAPPPEPPPEDSKIVLRCFIIHRRGVYSTCSRQNNLATHRRRSRIQSTLATERRTPWTPPNPSCLYMRSVCNHCGSSTCGCTKTLPVAQDGLGVRFLRTLARRCLNPKLKTPSSAVASWSRPWSL